MERKTEENTKNTSHRKRVRSSSSPLGHFLLTETFTALMEAEKTSRLVFFFPMVLKVGHKFIKLRGRMVFFFCCLVQQNLLQHVRNHCSSFKKTKTLTSTHLTDICAEMGLAWCPDSHWVMGRWRRWDQAGNPPWEGVKAVLSAFAGT